MINSGFILINKDNDYSSNKIDQIIKKKLNLNKVGHLGTLDPLAKGLLVLGINDGTKYFKYFDNLDKTYILNIRLGATSDSLDNETEIRDFIDTDLRNKKELIDELLLSFKGKYNQVPPLYSAIKIDGKKGYDIAKTNKDLKLKEREVEICDVKRISEIEYRDGSTYFDIYLHVSRGFYVRSFAHDFGVELNVPGMANKIYRTSVGKFDIKNSYTIDNIGNEIINPLDYLDFKRVEVSDNETKYVLNGIPYKYDSVNEYIVLTNHNEPLAIYKKNNSEYKMDLLIKR